MGAWGYGPFDNDGGMDFIGELAERPGEAESALREVMTVAKETDYLDRDEASAAIVAACLVADRVSPGLITDTVGREYADRLVFVPSEELRELAAGVFSRAYQPMENEWYELWDDADALPLVHAEHDPFQLALSSREG
ncbi:DUF4259 domain-containing protein [Actinocorallia aurantiaca]|jgi:hypothetical protein|uniref:DUF4259 domain-containing protein n=1 Tax=Actinocorallia aurantiaca TaxID=46204 RepID=A0ABP6GQM8_9ACTN